MYSRCLAIRRSARLDENVLDVWRTTRRRCLARGHRAGELSLDAAQRQHADARNGDSQRNGTQVTTQVLFNTPAPNLPAPAQETFTYRVTDGHSESAPGTVTVNVSPLIPITIDDTFTEPASNSGPVQDQFHVMANDLFGFSDTRILTLTPVTPNAQTAMTIDVTNPKLVDFVAGQFPRHGNLAVFNRQPVRSDGHLADTVHYGAGGRCDRRSA